jgi:hypothetical protein
MLAHILRTRTLHFRVTPHGIRLAAGGFAACVALAVLWTWPLAAHLSSRIPHDSGDPLLNIWLLWWNARTVPFTASWWNPPIFHPMTGALALSEHLAGIGLISTPLQWLGASPLTGYNVAFILSFGLSGFCAALLVWRLAGSSHAEAWRLGAAACAALAYGFAPYRAGQLAHLQVLTSQWMPLALFAMHAYIADGRRKWLAVFAAAWLVQASSNGYYLLFFPILLALWLLWFPDWRRAPARGVVLGLTWAGASLLLLPVLIRYAAVQRGLGLARTPGEMVMFSATPASFLHASGMLRFWPTTPTLTTEEFLFPGLTPIVLVVAACAGGVYRLRRVGSAAAGRSPIAGSADSDRPSTPALTGSGRSPLVFYVSAAMIMWWLALGPALPEAPLASRVRPYTLLALLPGYDALRVPARFAMLATLCMSTAAGLAFLRLEPRRRMLQPIMAAAAILGLAVDGWLRPMPLAPPPGRVVLPDMANAVVLELPAHEDAVDVAAMYRATVHQYPIVNGYSGHTPPHYAILSLALRRGDPSVITELARTRPLVIIVNPSFDRTGDMLRLVRSIPGIEPHGGSSAGLMFSLAPVPPGPVAPVGDVWPAVIRHAPNNYLDIDLGAARVVRAIGFPLRSRFAELDRRISVEGSLEGTRWLTMWEGWTGAPSLAAAIQNPLEAPVRLPIADLTARYLRLHPVSPWMRQAIAVYGPN